MTLKEYIIKRGEYPLAKELGVSPDTVKSWRYGNREPRPRQAKKLILMTGYAMTWEDIYAVSYTHLTLPTMAIV